MIEIGTATDHIDLLNKLDTFLTATGSAYGLTYAGTGTGTLTAKKGGATSVAETFTITATSATSFTVVGSVTGSIGPATVGTPFSHAKLAFLLTAGGTAFTAGDVFTLSTAPKWITKRKSMGSTVLASAGNTGSYGAQNLVDGKFMADVPTVPGGGGQLRMYLVQSAVLPIDIEVTLYASGTVKDYQMGMMTTAYMQYGPKTWTFDYWNGSAWVTLSTQTNEATWLEGEVRTYAVTPTAATKFRLHITAQHLSSNFTLGFLRLRDSNNVDMASGEVIWQAPGNDGTSEIFVGVRPFQRADADYWNWELVGMDGFVASSHLRDQPGIEDRLYLPLWNDSIPYWFIADGVHVKVVAKVNTQYESAYLGLLDPYFSPNQWPYPLAVGGALAFGETVPYWESTSFRWSNSTNRHRAYTHADNEDSPPSFSSTHVQLKVRNVDGNWLGFEATNADNSSGNADSWRNVIWPYRGGMSKIDVCLDGSYALFPVLLNAGTPNTVGQLRGVFAVSGQGLTAETLIQMGAVDHMAVMNITRTDRDDFFAVALD